MLDTFREEFKFFSPAVSKLCSYPEAPRLPTVSKVSFFRSSTSMSFLTLISLWICVMPASCFFLFPVIQGLSTWQGSGLCLPVPFSIQKIDDCHQNCLHIWLKKEVILVLTGKCFGLIGSTKMVGSADYAIWYICRRLNEWNLQPWGSDKCVAER